jgi:hypothetical protein
MRRSIPERRPLLRGARAIEGPPSRLAHLQARIRGPESTEGFSDARIADSRSHGYSLQEHVFALLGLKALDLVQLGPVEQE